MCLHVSEWGNGDSAVYFNFFGDILSCNTVLKMQERSLVFSLKDSMSRKTMYSHGIEVSAASEMIASHAFRSEKIKKYRDERYRLYTMLSYSGILRSIGQPPFGFTGNYAIRNWFSENHDNLYFEGKKVFDILSPEMKDDILNFSGTKRALRYLKKYSDSDISFVNEIIYGIVDAESYHSKISALYSEREFVKFTANKDYHKGALSYILEAAAYIVSATSILDDSVRNSCVVSHQVMRFLRSNDDFCDDITEDEYQKYCTLVNLLDESGTEKMNPGNYMKSEAETVRKWMILLRNEMCRSAAECLADNYSLISEGNFKKDLISGSWCRILKPLFFKLLIVLKDSVKYVDSCLNTEKVISGLTEKIVKTAMKYDSSEKLSSIEEKILFMIPEIYKKVYKNESTGKSEYEKLYLRILMALDYICDMTDRETETIYGKIC